MPVYLVIYSSIYDYHLCFALKTIHRIIPTIVTSEKIELDEALRKCSDLLYRAQNPYCQWELVSRPDNSHLEAIAKEAAQSA